MRSRPSLTRVLCASLAMAFALPPTQLLAQDPPPLGQEEEVEGEPILDLTCLDRLDVDPTTGELVFSSEDLRLGEGDQAFSLVRTWRPFTGDAADFGYHWASPLSIHLDVDRGNERAGLVDADGVRTFFRKDPKGVLRSISGRPGEITVMAEGFLLAGLGDERTYRFDKDGFLQEVTGPSCSLRYGWKDQQLAKVDGPWGTLRFERDDEGRLLRAVAPGNLAISYTFDGDGNLLRVTKPGLVEDYGYDPLGRLRTLAGGQGFVSWDASSRVTAISGEGVRPVKLSYEQSDEVERAQVTTVVRDGKTTTVAVSRDGRRIATSLPDEPALVTVTRLDERLRPVEVKNADGRTYTWTWDERGRPVVTKSPTGAVRYEYGSKVTDRPTRIELEDGRTVDLVYDLKGLLTSLTATGAGTTTWSYDERGRIVETTDPRGAVTRYQWDERSLLAQVEEVGVATTRYGRDAEGRIRAVKAPTGQLVKVDYDAQGRVQLVSDPRGTIFAASYDGRGRLLRYLDELGRETTYEYSRQGELLAARDSLGLIGKWTYGSDGRLATFTDGAGNETRWERPDARTLVVRDPTTGVRTLSFDGLGRLTKEVRAGAELGYRYDALGNLASRTTPSGQETFAHDGFGRLTGVSGPAGGLELRYGEDGRLAATKEKAFGREVGYGYTPAGDRAELRLPWGTVKYRHDAHGRVTGVDLPSGEKIEIALRADGSREAIRYPNGVVTRFAYERGQLVDIHTVKGENTLDRRRYGWDARGQLAWSEDAKGQRTTYEHDARGRLTNAKGPAGEQKWTYDLAGNRTSQNEAAATVGAGNRIASDGARKLGYAAGGAVTTITDARGTTKLSYDVDDHLVEAEQPDGTKVRYGYAPNGTRLWREDAKGRVYYLSDLADVVAELDANGNVLAGYVHGPEDDDVLAAVKGGESFFYHYDLVRSVTAVTAKDGRVAARYSYDPFGVQQQAEGDAVAWNPFRYTSRELDRATGLYHFRARTYSAELGRFTSADPLGRMGGFNLYAYVDNDPTIWNDPYGTDKQPWWKRALGAVRDFGSSVVNTTVAFGKALKDDFVSGDMGRRVIAFGKGFGKGLWSAGKGIVNMVLHPVDTVNGIIYAIENWDETKEALLAKWREYKDAAANDPEKFAEMTGFLTAEILTSVVGTKGLGVLAKSKTLATAGRMAANTARVAGSPVTRVASRGTAALASRFPNAARVVNTGARWSRVRDLELARRAAATGNIVTRTGRRLANTGRDLTTNVARMAVRNPGAFVVYSGIRMSKTALNLVASTGRGLWTTFKVGGLPAAMAFEDQITDAINRTASREAAGRDVGVLAKRFLADAPTLQSTPDELARRLAEVGQAYDTYRNRLMAPVHAEDVALAERLKQLNDEVAAGRIPANTIDSRLEAVLSEFARRRLVVLTDIFERNKDAAHDMFNPSPNRLVAYGDEIAFIDAALAKVTNASARALLEARKADLMERAALEEERFRMGEHEALIAGIAGAPREPGEPADAIPEQPVAEGNMLDDLIAPAAPSEEVEEAPQPGLSAPAPAPTPTTPANPWPTEDTGQ